LSAPISKRDRAQILATQIAKADQAFAPIA
jgi:hypothetical protein